MINPFSWLGGLSPGQQRLRRVLVFLLRLIILSLPLYMVITFSVNLLFMQQAVAGNVLWVLNSAGYSAAQDGISITIEGGQPFTFLITEDCTAWKSMLFFFALVFAVSGVLLKKRLLALLIGLPLIWVCNILRIFVIVGVQQSYGLEAAMFWHNVTWQAGLITLILVLWGVWFFRFSGALQAGETKETILTNKTRIKT